MDAFEQNQTFSQHLRTTHQSVSLPSTSSIFPAASLPCQPRQKSKPTRKPHIHRPFEDDFAEKFPGNPRSQYRTSTNEDKISGGKFFFDTFCRQQFLPPPFVMPHFQSTNHAHLFGFNNFIYDNLKNLHRLPQHEDHRIPDDNNSSDQLKRSKQIESQKVKHLASRAREETPQPDSSDADQHSDMEDLSSDTWSDPMKRMEDVLNYKMETTTWNASYINSCKNNSSTKPDGKLSSTRSQRMEVDDCDVTDDLTSCDVGRMETKKAKTNKNEINKGNFNKYLIIARFEINQSEECKEGGGVAWLEIGVLK